jgi:predicted nucleic acid-binding protein
MATFSLDSNCMIAAVCGWHEHHGAAAAAIEERFDRGDRMVVAAHAMVEAYAVLTRLPSPHRLAPADAWALVKTNFVAGAALATLPAAAHVTLLDTLAGAGLGGGRSYDALIAATAAQAKVDELLTFNPRHFDPPPDGITVIEPPPPTLKPRRAR